MSEKQTAAKAAAKTVDPKPGVVYLGPMIELKELHLMPRSVWPETKIPDGVKKLKIKDKLMTLFVSLVDYTRAKKELSDKNSDIAKAYRAVVAFLKNPDGDK